MTVEFKEDLRVVPSCPGNLHSAAQFKMAKDPVQRSDDFKVSIRAYHKDLSLS